MLPTYQNATDVTVSIDIPMVGGSVLSPASTDYEILAQDGSIVLPRATVPVEAIDGARITLTIPAAKNTVPDDEIRALRLVRVYFVMEDGAVQSTQTRYTIEKADKLIVMGNSIQTIEEAILTRLDLPGLDGWDATDENGQIAAMITAWSRMCQMTYRYRLSQNALEFDSLRGDLYWCVSDMRLRTMEDYSRWPKDFITALKRAQVIEANSALAGDPVAERRRLGIISETTGEAKMFFNTKPPLRMAICADALGVLGPYLYTGVRLGRA